MQPQFAADSFIEENAEMDQDLKKSLKEVSDGVSALLRHASTERPNPPTAFPPQQQTNAQIWVSRLGIAGSLTAIFVTFGGIAKYVISSELTKALIEPNTSITKLQDNVGVLQQDIQRLTNQQSALIVAHPAGSTPKALGDASAQLQKQGIELPSRVVAEAGQALLKIDKGDAGYWPAAAQLISYHSSLATPEAQLQAILSFRPCSPVDMEGADRNAYAQVIGPDDKPTGPKSHLTHVSVQNCAVQLDGKTISGWTCTHCLIRYSGGPLTIRNTKFIDCLFVFEFHPEQMPPPNGQRFSETLLAASDLKDVTVAGE